MLLLLQLNNYLQLILGTMDQYGVGSVPSKGLGLAFAYTATPTTTTTPTHHPPSTR
jgi:hypothetical protein